MPLTFRILEDVGIITFDHDDSKVNILSSEVLLQLDKTLDDVRNNDQVKALIFVSKKKNCFIAGADIKEIEKIVEPKDGAAKAKQGQDIFNKIEDLPMPTFAIIDGVALGGGCELALACLYRIATFNPKVRIGLPEVNLGFVPGFGGTYRLPRIVGLSESLKMILTAKPVDGSKALRSGLVDKLFPQTRLEQHVMEFVHLVVAGKIKKKRYNPKKKRGLLGLLESNRLLHSVIYSQSRANVIKQSKGFYPAPLKAIEIVRKNYYMGRKEGLGLEAEAFGELAVTDISKNLVNVFYLMEKSKKVNVEGVENSEIQTVMKAGVLGAGIMGGGIAQLLSSRDIWSRMKDISLEALAKGLQSASQVYHGAVKRKRLTSADASRKMAQITTTLDYSGFQDVDIVIEAVVENLEVKQKVFKELSEVVAPRTILASNTSALSIEQMAKVCKDPSKVIGFHFFNPVHRMPLVEIITAVQTSKETTASALALVRTLGKMPILVKDSCGFIVNRILLGYINEAGRILEEGEHFEEIDKLIEEFGMPMGPFRLSDEVGLDVGVKVLKILEESFGERFKPVDIFNKVIEKGLLGKKSKKGFYIHDKKRVPNPEIWELNPIKGSFGYSKEDFVKRMILIMINEAAQCLEEGIVDDAASIDIGMIFGTGFPPFRGGLLRYADQYGVSQIVEDLKRFQIELDDDRFEPSAYLLKLQKEKKGFYG